MKNHIKHRSSIKNKIVILYLAFLYLEYCTCTPFFKIKSARKKEQHFVKVRKLKWLIYIPYELGKFRNAVMLQRKYLKCLS